MDEKDQKGIRKKFTQIIPEAPVSQPGRNSPLAKIIEVLRNKKSFLITSHLRPDGDAVGSQLALASLLEEMGKSVTIVDTDPIPDNFRFLPGSNRIINNFASQNPPEVALVLDTSDLDRTGKAADLARKTKFIINIDHHISNKKFGNINLVEEKASAVGEQIYSLIHSLGFPIGRERAISLYTAILTDTGSFRYTNTTEKTHRIVSSLLREGLDPADVVEKVYKNISFSRQKLLGLALTTLQKSNQGKIAWFYLTREMYREAEAKDTETDGFIDYIQSIKGVKLALLFREMDEKNHIRVSFRSKGEINVDSLARKFGGGGHRGAAGCLIEGTIEEIEKKILTAARELAE